MSRASRLLSWLRKPVAPGQLVPQMEGLRCAALWLVFLLHFHQAVLMSMPESLHAVIKSSALARVCEAGDFGVQLFFAISGFVLALPFAKWRLKEGKPVTLKRYFFRRLIRLEPPLLINLILLTPLAVWVFHKLSLSDVPWHFGWTMGYGHRLFLGEQSPINRVTWSLETEAQFYVLMPLLAHVFRITNAGPRRLTLIILGLICLPFKDHLNRALILSHLEYFMGGLLLADLYVTKWSQTPAGLKRWDGIGALAWMGMFGTLLLFPSNQIGTHFLLALCTGLAFAAALRGPISSRFWSLPWLTLCGGMCYTFYLYHDPVIKASVAALRRVASAEWSYDTRFVGGFLIVAPLTLVISAVLFALFERPFMGWKSRPERERKSLTS